MPEDELSQDLVTMEDHQKKMKFSATQELYMA